MERQTEKLQGESIQHILYINMHTVDRNFTVLPKTLLAGGDIGVANDIVTFIFFLPDQTPVKPLHVVKHIYTGPEKSYTIKNYTYKMALKRR